MSGKITTKYIRDKLEDDKLDLSVCNLESVPVKEIAAIKRFSYLDLSNNVLITLPDTFASLTHLIKLDLSKNMLTKVPDNIGDLKQLKYLDLYSNKISRLPLSLGELKNLKWLDLKENPLTTAVATIAGPCNNSKECFACARNIVSYLEKAKITINEKKLSYLNAIQEIEKNTFNNKKEAKKKKNVEKKIVEIGVPSSVKKEKYEKNNTTKSKFKPKNECFRQNKTINGGALNLLCKAFICIIMWSVSFALLTIIIVIIFPLYNQQLAEEFFKYIEIRFGMPLKSYHYESIRFMEIFIHKMKLWTDFI